MAEMTQVEWRNHIARQKAKRKQQIEEAKAAPEVKEAEAPEVTEDAVEPTTDAKMEDAPVEVVEEVVEEAVTVAIAGKPAPEVPTAEFAIKPEKEDLGKQLEAAAKENGFFPNKLVTEAVAATLAANESKNRL